MALEESKTSIDQFQDCCKSWALTPLKVKVNFFIGLPPGGESVWLDQLSSVGVYTMS